MPTRGFLTRKGENEIVEDLASHWAPHSTWTKQLIRFLGLSVFRDKACLNRILRTARDIFISTLYVDYPY
jgi:hypothetical protein